MIIRTKVSSSSPTIFPALLGSSLIATFTETRVAALFVMTMLIMMPIMSATTYDVSSPSTLLSPPPPSPHHHHHCQFHHSLQTYLYGIVEENLDDLIHYVDSDVENDDDGYDNDDDDFNGDNKRISSLKLHQVERPKEDGHSRSEHDEHLTGKRKRNSEDERQKPESFPFFLENKVKGEHNKNDRRRNKILQHSTINEQHYSQHRSTVQQQIGPDLPHHDGDRGRHKRYSGEKIQIREWLGDISDQFKAHETILTIDRDTLTERNVESGKKSTRYRCIKEFYGSPHSTDGVSLGDGKKFTYIVESTYPVYAGQEEPSGTKITCIKLILRSPEVMQIAVSNKSSLHLDVFDASAACSAESMKQNDWLFVDGYNIAAAKQNCLIRGGFEMKMFDKRRREPLCDAFDRETRYESSCSTSDASQFKFNFRYPKCVPSELTMRATQDLVCAASWNQSSHIYTVLRSKSRVEDSESDAVKNALPKDLLEFIRRRKNQRLPFSFSHATLQSFNRPRAKKDQVYLWLFSAQVSGVLQGQKFSATLSLDLVAGLGKEFRSGYISMPSGRDVVRNICEDDYEACSFYTDEKPCSFQIRVMCPRTCGLCVGNASFTKNDPTASHSLLDQNGFKVSEPVPSFCSFPQSLLGDWLEVAYHRFSSRGIANLSFETDSFSLIKAESDQMSVAESFLIRSTAGRLATLKCIQFDPAVTDVKSAPLSQTPSKISFLQLMVVSSHENGCMPRYSCIKVFQLNSNLAVVASSKEVTWPLVSRETLEDLGPVINCKTAEMINDNFYPKRNFRLFARKDYTKTQQDDVADATPTNTVSSAPDFDGGDPVMAQESITIDGSTKDNESKHGGSIRPLFNAGTCKSLLKFFNPANDHKLMFADGMHCKVEIFQADKTSIKVRLTNCFRENSYRHHHHHHDQDHHHDLVNISLPHRIIFRNHKITCTDAIYLPYKHRDTSAEVEEYDTFVVTWVNNIDVTDGPHVPYCWLMTGSGAEEHESPPTSSSSPPNNSTIFLFSGKGCVNGLERFVTSNDPVSKEIFEILKKKGLRKFLFGSRFESTESLKKNSLAVISRLAAQPVVQSSRTDLSLESVNEIVNDSSGNTTVISISSGSSESAKTGVQNETETSSGQEIPRGFVKVMLEVLASVIIAVMNVAAWIKSLL